MILLDCGNSSLKAQLRASGRVRASFACAYRGDWSERLHHWMSDLDSERCYQSSVLDAVRQSRLDACLAEKFGEDVIRFRSKARAGGVVNGYERPAQLGVDRWLAMIGATELVSDDCVVIDAGSAITLDLLRADGRHLGGAILPGVNTSLRRFRQIFSHIDFDDPRIGHCDQPGCSTEAAIQIDYPRDSIERLRELVSEWTQQLDPNASLLLAGGDAPRLQSRLERPCRIVPDLVFLGMCKLAEQ
ncbi:MAG: type III pantothenate kinase [Gammaproteobacteria bacterium]|nr:type III pantothenate kinase [Gammaproteobacteria bacterium]